MLRFPCRCAVVVLAATEYDTTPLPVPPPPAVMLNHAAPLVAVHAQPPTAVTVTVPFDAPPPTDTLAGEMDELQGEVNAKVLELVLRPVPFGPTAATRASYVVPAAGQGLSRVVKSTRILPSPCGEGFPRFVTRTASAPPTR